jgi:hypothetical protein
MGRALNLILLAVMIFGAIITYDMKHDAEVAADNVARLQSDVASERDQISLLRAELSLLTQPSRLQSVVSTYQDYFQLKPFAPDQIGAINEIPLRPNAARDDIARLASGPVEATGSIRLAPR